MAIKSGSIDREEFLSFCNELTIIIEMPKASLDLRNPGGIENVIIQQVEKLGDCYKKSLVLASQYECKDNLYLLVKEVFQRQRPAKSKTKETESSTTVISGCKAG